jgi:hypothetical protein
MRERFGDSFVLGIIDKDKKEVPYLQEFDLVSSVDSLLVYKHQTKHHYIIQITPAIERFLLKAAEERNVDMASYKLPIDLKGLTQVTKHMSGKNEKAFEALMKLFKDISDASEFQRLAALIQYLGDNTYQVDIEELQRISKS